MAHNGRLNVYSLLQDDRCCCGYKCGSECCSVHTWIDNLRDSLPHLNVTCSVYVATVVHVCGVRQKDAQGNQDALKQRILMFSLFFKGMAFCSCFERNATQIKIYIFPYDYLMTEYSFISP